MTDLDRDNPGLRDLISEAASIAKDKGWDENQDTIYASDIAATLMLIVSEAAEALEVIRDGHEPWEVWHSLPDNRPPGVIFSPEEWVKKPEGYGVELADICIRIFHETSRRGIDLPKLIVEKMEFNRTRPHRHGGKAL